MFTCKHDPAQQSIKESRGGKKAWCIRCGEIIEQVTHPETKELIWVCKNPDYKCDER